MWRLFGSTTPNASLEAARPAYKEAARVALPRFYELMTTATAVPDVLRALVERHQALVRRTESHLSMSAGADRG